ncbi:MAG: hypothetical protein M3Z03_11820 [Actinomycetota bacterium]|nr:hypothetical protein [Actinomycetota bacterium]
MEEPLPIDGLDLDASEREAAETLLRWRLLADLDVMSSTLAELHFGVVSELYGGMPVDGSPMAADIAEHGAAVVAEVGRICGTWQVVGSDQLRAVVAAHSAGLMAFGIGPLLRSVLEHAVRVGWVLDGASGRDKGARAWLALVVGNGEDAATHRNKNSPVSTLAGAPERLRGLCEVSIPAAFGEVPLTKGQTKDWSLCRGEICCSLETPRSLEPGSIGPTSSSGPSYADEPASELRRRALGWPTDSRLDSGCGR